VKIQNNGTCARSVTSKGKIVLVAPLEVIDLSPEDFDGFAKRGISDAWVPVDPPAFPPGVKISITVPARDRPGQRGTAAAISSLARTADRPIGMARRA
jgi:hypothetical protein